MIRTDRWNAVYAEVERELKARVPELMKGASHRWGAMRWPADAIPPAGVRPENVAYVSEDTGEIRHMFVVLTGRTIGPSRVGAAYPFVPHGAAVDVEIKALHPSETGIEGEVTAAYAGHEFRFFEPLWGVKRNNYKVGTQQRIRFAGFGHALAGMNGAPAKSPEAEGAPAEAAAAPIAPAPGTPAPGATEPQSALVMIGPGASSRYGMHAPIVEWRGFWTGERLYYALTLRLFEDGDKRFAVDLYAGRHCFQGNFTPAAGMAVAGVMWLHGTLAD